MADIRLMQEIYSRLGDRLSKEIFRNRLMYSITKDEDYAYANVRKLCAGGGIWEKMIQFAQKDGMVIFGAGKWGREFYKATRQLPWKCFIDNYPQQDSYEGLPIIRYQDFFRNYEGEAICILSKYHKEMYEQLLGDGIHREQIINIGDFLEGLASRQYFDLKCLPHEQGREIFVDAGSFDGMTSVYFKQWCQGDAFAYVFEPDRTCRQKCIENLEKYQVSYEFFQKGVWSGETKLRFNYLGNGNNSGRIEEQGDEIIEAVSLDSILSDKKITFIKMDIEGAEYQALLGAERIIRKHQPKLAVSIYHRLEDILQIPEIILKFCPQYRLYLRHYSVKKYETVLYALP